MTRCNDADCSYPDCDCCKNKEFSQLTTVYWRSLTDDQRRRLENFETIVLERSGIRIELTLNKNNNKQGQPGEHGP